MKKVNLEKIIAVSGMSGLFRIISNGTKGVIVENITDKKRTIVLNNSKIFTLDTIRIFVNDGELPISEAMYRLYDALNGKEAPHHKTSSDEEIKSVFEKSIPEYDKERVNINNMRKLFQWYNTLLQANALNIIEENTETNTSDASKNSNELVTTEVEPTPKKASKKSDTSTEEKNETSEPTAPKKRGRKKKTENE
ncbi:MAG: DUF5606 domain-containing protein [Bacteroidia bacterium]